VKVVGTRFRGAFSQIMKSTRKILAFDSWTGGSFNLTRLLPAFVEQGMTLTLVHIGSWGSDPGRPSQEKIGALEVRDVSSYFGKSFDEILDIERPDAVLMLSTQTFAHRAFLRYCRQRSIPTLHLYHGVANVQVTYDQTGSHKIGRVAYARYVASKLGKLVRLTFPCYVTALFKTRARPNEWIRFFVDVFRMARGLRALKAANDAGTSKAAVYTNADIEHAVRVYGLSANDVNAVGNPDLIRFGFKAHMLGVQNRSTTLDLDRVMYIDTALAIVGLLFKSQHSFVTHLIETSKALAEQGKKMVFKPHPAHNLTFLQESLKGTDIELVSNEQFLAKLMQCCACITETTSVALIPALIGLPLLYAKYGELKEQRFGPILTSYPRGYALEDMSFFATILRRDAQGFDPKEVNDWISFNAGPLPAEEMPQRVARIVQSLILQCQPAKSLPCTPLT
jgi:hypothetical protein